MACASLGELSPRAPARRAARKKGRADGGSAARRRASRCFRRGGRGGCRMGRHGRRVSRRRAEDVDVAVPPRSRGLAHRGRARPRRDGGASSGRGTRRRGRGRRSRCCSATTPAGRTSSARFRQEAIAVNIINHPGIVRVFDSGEVEDGSPLHRDGVPGWAGAARLGAGRAGRGSVAQAGLLGCRSRRPWPRPTRPRKVVHRDLQPENIMVIDDELAPGAAASRSSISASRRSSGAALPEVLELDARGSSRQRPGPAPHRALGADGADGGDGARPRERRRWAGIASGPASDARTTAARAKQSSTAEGDPREVRRASEPFLA